MIPSARLGVRNGQAFRLDEVPDQNVYHFRERVVTRVALGARLVTLFGVPLDGARVVLLAVLAEDDDARIELLRTEIEDRYPALTPDCIQASRFERELCEQLGVLPEGHPWLKPVRSEERWGPGPLDLHLPDRPMGADYPFFAMTGDEVHEVAVGPVHAGIIEPGHFRFQCHGEKVFSLEISLGYQHRGVERAMKGGPDKRTIHYMETLAGDTTAGHATAYSQAYEALAGVKAAPRGNAIRAIALELERLANHAGDLGALAGDVGFLPTASYCGRIRGDFLNMTALICGSRFGRGLIRPGGAGFDIDGSIPAELEGRLKLAMRDMKGAADLLFETPSVIARLENTGVVPTEVALSLGLVGPAARASGVSCDIRNNFPAGHYVSQAVPGATVDTGDVFARAMVRWMEMENSADYILRQLDRLPDGPVRAETRQPLPGRITVSLTEGWRGEICHVAMTDDTGRFAWYKVVDPSFHNWAGLAMALRGQQISDFPLCNKSFNLSYCGHDL